MQSLFLFRLPLIAFKGVLQNSMLDSWWLVTLLGDMWHTRITIANKIFVDTCIHRFISMCMSLYVCTYSLHHISNTSIFCQMPTLKCSNEGNAGGNEAVVLMHECPVLRYLWRFVGQTCYVGHNNAVTSIIHENFPPSSLSPVPKRWHSSHAGQKFQLPVHN